MQNASTFSVNSDAIKILLNIALPFSLPFMMEAGYLEYFHVPWSSIKITPSNAMISITVAAIISLAIALPSAPFFLFSIHTRNNKLKSISSGIGSIVAAAAFFLIATDMTLKEVIFLFLALAATASLLEKIISKISQKIDAKETQKQSSRSEDKSKFGIVLSLIILIHLMYFLFGLTYAKFNDEFSIIKGTPDRVIILQQENISITKRVDLIKREVFGDIERFDLVQDKIKISQMITGRLSAKCEIDYQYSPGIKQC